MRSGEIAAEHEHDLRFAAGLDQRGRVEGRADVEGVGALEEAVQRAVHADLRLLGTAGDAQLPADEGAREGPQLPLDGVAGGEVGHAERVDRGAEVDQLALDGVAVSHAQRGIGVGERRDRHPRAAGVVERSSLGGRVGHGHACSSGFGVDRGRGSGSGHGWVPLTGTARAEPVCTVQVPRSLPSGITRSRARFRVPAEPSADRLTRLDQHGRVPAAGHRAEPGDRRADADRRDDVTVDVTDRRREARHPDLPFVDGLGPAPGANGPELGAQRGGFDDRVRGQPGSGPRERNASRSCSGRWASSTLPSR